MLKGVSVGKFKEFNVQNKVNELCKQDKGFKKAWEHRNKINVLTILKVKWLNGQCRHICLFCHYRNDCFDNLER